MRLTTSF